MEWLLLPLASAFAGFIDSIVGGGGLILVPVLFGMFPGAAPATLLGTNKSASVWGTAAATVQFSRKVEMRWRALGVAAALAFGGSLAGAWAVTQVSGDFLRRLLPFILIALLAYTLVRKDMGRHHAPRFTGRAELAATGAVGLALASTTASSARGPAASSSSCSCAGWATTSSTPRPRPSCSTP